MLQNQIANFAHKLIVAGDDFYSGKVKAGTNPIAHPDSDSRTWNNWQTWMLAVRAEAAALLRDENEISSTRNLIDTMIDKNLFANGSGFDFEHCDALHYHIYNLEAWLNLAWFTPQVLTLHHIDLIERALIFIEPY